MPKEKDSEAALGNAWGTEVDYEAEFYKDEDEEDGDEELEDGEEETEEEDEEPDSNAESEAQKLFTKWQEDLVKSIEDGNSDNAVYKGLQKVISRKDKDIDESKKLLDAAIARMDEYESLITQMNSGFGWLTETVFGAIEDEEVKAKAIAKLQESQNTFLKGELEKAKKPATKPAQQPQVSGNEDQMAQVKKYVEEFIDGRKGRAKKAGVDPTDKRLDYGLDTEPIAARLAKFEDSLDKILEENDDEKIDGVRPKGKTIGTRSSSGGGKPVSSSGQGKSLLQRGSEDRIAMMKKMGG